ncbi:hypothetical protein CSIM01_12990 [Colletotrichum simmondsii]|uniref:ABC transporter n=1 Tax=Colletotrichum simmondsii TaxID=703756 RepID=A0A135RN44_9PEZI|nr:hypothetical protein CSIM01_12990 [Colletotrichum simmondsii]
MGSTLVDADGSEGATQTKNPDTNVKPSEEAKMVQPDEISALAAYKRIFEYGGSFERTLHAIAAVAAIASGAGIALQTLIFGDFITTITKFSSKQLSPVELRDDATRLALYFVYLGIGRFCLSYLYNSLFTYTSHCITRNIRHEYLKSALRQEVAFFDFGSGGSIATQAVTNGRLIQGGISEKLGLTFQGLSAFITAFIIAFVVQWKLTLICLCIAPATLLINGAVAGVMAGHETNILEIHAEANGFAENVLSGIRTIHAFEMRHAMVDKFESYLANAHHVGKKISPLFGLLFSAEYCIIYLGYALAFWQGVRMLARGEIDAAGKIFTVLLSVIIAATNLTILAPYFIDFTKAATAAARLFILMDRQSRIDPFSVTGKEPSRMTGEIKINNVTFAYPTRPGATVLDNFSLRIPAGKVTALVGPSGSGKSTIVGLIERWYNPSSGNILIDDTPIDELNLKWVRKNVRLVQQEPVLFKGTVFDNIQQGLVGTQWEHASREDKMERVRQAADLAFAHDFISDLPDGYDTDIGQRGGLLSGGQKQRIAIARSVVSSPTVLLLDEATSALDPHAESIVQKALDQASQGRTTIVIAHKLATIQKADNIVVMRKGMIAEQGTHDSLLRIQGLYSRLVEVQGLTVSEPETGADEAMNFIDTAVAGANEPGEAFGLTKTLTEEKHTLQSTSDIGLDQEDYDKHKQRGIFSVIAYIAQQTPELTLTYLIILAACAMAGATYPGQAILLSHVMEVFELNGSAMERRGEFYSKMFIALAGGCLLAYFILGFATNVVAQHLSHKFRRESLQNMLRQDLRFFDRPENSTGALVSRIDSNPQSVLELMGYNVGLLLVCVFNILSCSILAIVYSWNLGLVVVLGGLPPLVGAGYFKIRLDAKMDRDTANRYSASASIASEAVTAIRTVSSLSIEEPILKKYVTELDHAVAGCTRPILLIMVCFAFTQAIEYWFLALGFWYGCRLLSYDQVTLFSFFVAFMSVFYSGQAAAQLFQYSTSITKGVNAGNYISWLQQLQPTIRETVDNGDKGPGSGGGTVDFSGVRFSYPMRPDVSVLRGIDLKIKNGQFVALVGASGCGKSTTVALLERFYDPSTGSININDSALASLSPRLYRRTVGLVQQEPTLFVGSVRENVALGIEERGPGSTAVSDEQVENALRAANAWDFVSSLPDGLATPAGFGGAQLSGGQRQRIAIARALIRNPKILLLDEATSALDTESEKIVQAALAKAAKQGDRITVAVAHRLSTIKDADLICVFYKGRIREMGTHQELIKAKGMYHKMCEAQSLD